MSVGQLFRDNENMRMLRYEYDKTITYVTRPVWWKAESYWTLDL